MVDVDCVGYCYVGGDSGPMGLKSVDGIVRRGEQEA
jgi:hypothetical protein